MAITKTTEEDKIEIVGTGKDTQVRTATVIKEDGVELTRSFSRHVVSCVTSSHDGSSWTHTDTDVSGESAEVQAIANVVWTDSVKAAKKTANEAATL
tara:strand:+ start:1352 stop:1642 length:291 start_codon:yes stop_codon:yes gene_type:complete